MKWKIGFETQKINQIAQKRCYSSSESFFIFIMQESTSRNHTKSKYMKKSFKHIRKITGITVKVARDKKNYDNQFYEIGLRSNWLKPCASSSLSLHATELKPSLCTKMKALNNTS